MRQKTVLLFVALIAVILALVYYFHNHQIHNQDVQSGGMSAATKEQFLSLGVACYETYEVQGYESLEGVLKMFNIQGAHGFYSLNPGSSMDLKRGQILCVRGVWDVTARASGLAGAWVWPITVGGAAALGFSANFLYQRWSGAAAAAPGGSLLSV